MYIFGMDKNKVSFKEKVGGINYIETGQEWEILEDIEAERKITLDEMFGVFISNWKKITNPTITKMEIIMFFQEK